MLSVLSAENRHVHADDAYLSARLRLGGRLGHAVSAIEVRKLQPSWAEGQVDSEEAASGPFPRGCWKDFSKLGCHGAPPRGATVLRGGLHFNPQKVEARMLTAQESEEGLTLQKKWEDRQRPSAERGVYEMMWYDSTR